MLAGRGAGCRDSCHFGGCVDVGMHDGGVQTLRQYVDSDRQTVDLLVFVRDLLRRFHRL